MNHLGDLLSALIDGELTGTDLDRANAHLATCADCRTEAAELRQLKRALRALAEGTSGDLRGEAVLSARLLALDRSARPGRPRYPRPDYLVRGRLRRGPGRQTRRRTRVIWGAVSLMVVGIGAAAFAVGGGGSAPSERQVITPQFEVYDVHNAMTSGEVPFTGPADSVSESPQPPGTPKP